MNDSSERCIRPGARVLVRANLAGVHIGTLVEESADHTSVLLTRAQNVWSWEGALSTYELAVIGPTSARITMVAPESRVNGVDVILSLSAKAEAAFSSIAAWSR
jgi:hypothetical protein